VSELRKRKGVRRSRKKNLTKNEREAVESVDRQKNCTGGAGGIFHRFFSYSPLTITAFHAIIENASGESEAFFSKPVLVGVSMTGKAVAVKESLVPVRVWTLSECRKWREAGLQQELISLFEGLSLKKYETSDGNIVFCLTEVAEKLSVRYDNARRALLRVVPKSAHVFVDPHEITENLPSSNLGMIGRKQLEASNFVDLLFSGKKVYSREVLLARGGMIDEVFMTLDVAAELLLRNLQYNNKEAFDSFNKAVTDFKKREHKLIRNTIDVQDRHIKLKEGQESAYCHIPWMSEGAVYFKWVPLRYARSEACTVLRELFALNHARKTMLATQKRLAEWFPGVTEETLATECFPNPAKEENAEFWIQYFDQVQAKLLARFSDLDWRAAKVEKIKKENKEGYRIRKHDSPEKVEELGL
jgi:hypothetical protein